MERFSLSWWLLIRNGWKSWSLKPHQKLPFAVFSQCLPLTGLLRILSLITCLHSLANCLLHIFPRMAYITISQLPLLPCLNRLAERAVQSFKNSMKKMSGSFPLHTCLSSYLFRYRITLHSTTASPPAELLMRRNLRSTLDLLRSSVKGKSYFPKHDKTKHMTCTQR